MLLGESDVLTRVLELNVPTHVLFRNASFESQKKESQKKCLGGREIYGESETFDSRYQGLIFIQAHEKDWQRERGTIVND